MTNEERENITWVNRINNNKVVRVDLKGYDVLVPEENIDEFLALLELIPDKELNDAIGQPHQEGSEAL